MSAPVAGGGVDVLRNALDSLESREPFYPSMDDARAAIAAVAELIAADKEYDEAADELAEAKRAKGNWRVNPLGHNHPAVLRMRAAKARRAAALSNIEGGKA